MYNLTYPTAKLKFYWFREVPQRWPPLVCYIWQQNCSMRMACGRTTKVSHPGTNIIFLKGVGGGTMSEKKTNKKVAQQKLLKKNRARGAVGKNWASAFYYPRWFFYGKNTFRGIFFFCVTSVKGSFLFVRGSSTLGTLHYPGTNGAWRRIWLYKPLRITRYESSLKNNSHNLWSTLLVAENFTNRLMLITGLSRHNLWPPRVLSQWNFRKDGDRKWRSCRYSF